MPYPRSLNFKPRAATLSIMASDLSQPFVISSDGGFVSLKNSITAITLFVFKSYKMNGAVTLLKAMNALKNSSVPYSASGVKNSDNLALAST